MFARDGVGWGVITFMKLALMVDATPVCVLVALAHTVDATPVCVFFALAHMVDATQGMGWGGV